jgi:hypothetical protein
MRNFELFALVAFLLASVDAIADYSYGCAVGGIETNYEIKGLTKPYLKMNI